MWNFLTPSGVATTSVDFPSDLSLLLTGLVGIVWLSAGLLAWAAIHHYVAQHTMPVAEITLAPVDSQEAA